MLPYRDNPMPQYAGLSSYLACPQNAAVTGVVLQLVVLGVERTWHGGDQFLRRRRLGRVWDVRLGRSAATKRRRAVPADLVGTATVPLEQHRDDRGGCRRTSLDVSHSVMLTTHALRARGQRCSEM